ncbi:hypothetical protein V6N13_059462 [Hibiscus sabdariffa]
MRTNPAINISFPAAVVQFCRRSPFVFPFFRHRHSPDVGKPWRLMDPWVLCVAGVSAVSEHRCRGCVALPPLPHRRLGG